MSLNMNEVTLAGRVGRDPEIRYTQAGEPIANFSLATSETWKDKAGHKQERTEWHRVDVFGPTAKFVRDHVVKGLPLMVRGSIHYEEWNDKDGNKRNSTKIRVSGPRAFVNFVESKGSGGSRSEAPTGGGAGEPDAFQATDDDVPF